MDLPAHMNPSWYGRTLWNTLEPCGMSWKVTEACRTSWNVVEHTGATWKAMEKHRRSWNVPASDGNLPLLYFQ